MEKQFHLLITFLFTLINTIMKKLFIIAALAVVCTSVSAQFAKSKSASTAKSDGWSTIYLQYNPMTFNDDTGSGLGNLDYKGFYHWLQ